MIRSKIRSLALTALVLGFASGCGEVRHPVTDTPIVRNASSRLLHDDKPSAYSQDAKSTAIDVTLTLEKSRILGREFIYSLDLQYSSQFDEQMNLYTQSNVVGNTPVVFRIMGNELQLVTDNKLKFPSDNNHPEEIIGRFKILNQTDTTLTVSGLDSAPYLAAQMGPVDSISKNITYLDHWIRSFDFDANGNYLLQQSSIKMGDGKTIAEFMESIFPRESLKPGALFKKFEMDPTDPVGGAAGDVARFRFLPTDPIVKHDQFGEQKLSFAEHFDISPKADGTPGTIDWYVTPNIPDEYIAPVKQAVEGWNRYFVKMKGIERPVMRFMGKLPAGIYLGDPRYNVINWDSRLIAGAAYESQAADPESGRQSHSVIYMPAAWLKIGMDYWVKGIGSDETLKDSSVSTAKIRATQNVKCERDITDGMRLMASGRLMDDELKNFGVQLLKQTLFHEVGHALGFAHNFEGSLSYDPSNPKSIFSTSIMDYNDYELERAAFSDVNSADGPLLEYDRQTLSAIYNNDADFDPNDPALILPACNDAEADNEIGGVNPLCIRYDVQKDPTLSITTAMHRVEDATVDARDISLSQAIARITDLVTADARVSAVHSEDDYNRLKTQLSKALAGSLDFYIVSDVAALVRTTRTNIKSLLEFGIELPKDYNEQQMRERVFAGIQKSIAMTEIPATPKQALTQAIQTGVNRMTATPYFTSLPAADQSKKKDDLNQALNKVIKNFETSEAAGLPAARAKLLASLARHKDVDFFLGKEGDAAVDYEKNVVSLLADVVSAKTRNGVERIAAATALATFKGRLVGDNAVAAIKATLTEERATAASNDARRTIETVWKALGY